MFTGVFVVVVGCGLGFPFLEEGVEVQIDSSSVLFGNPEGLHSREEAVFVIA